MYNRRRISFFYMWLPSFPSSIYSWLPCQILVDGICMVNFYLWVLDSVSLVYEYTYVSVSMPVFHFFFFNWRITALQCCVGFCCTTWISSVCLLSHSVLSNSLWPPDYSPPDSSFHGILQARILGFHGILQARILEWVAISYSRGSSWLRDQTRVSCTACISRCILYHWATLEAGRRQWHPTPVLLPG